MNKSGRFLSLLLQEERRSRRGTGVITFIVTSVVTTTPEYAGNELVISVAVQTI